MEEINYYENQFIRADALISNGDIAGAKEILESILEELPDFGKAHNHLGWILYYKLSDAERGSYHYQLAMKFDPHYPAAYLNYAYLLIDLGRIDEAKQHITSVMQGVGKSDLASYYCELGRINELELNFIGAFKQYRTAKYHACSDQFIATLNANMNRVKAKMNLVDHIKSRFI